MKNTVEVNNYDYKKMIKDFETDERFQNIKKRLKKKYEQENKKYNSCIEHMKELREKIYQKKKANLINKLSKKENLLLTSLENIKIDKYKEKKKLNEEMSTKKNNVKINIEKVMEKQEKNRIDFQKETNLKCNEIYNIINI